MTSRISSWAASQVTCVLGGYFLSDSSLLAKSAAEGPKRVTESDGGAPAPGLLRAMGSRTVDGFSSPANSNSNVACREDPYLAT